MKILFLAFALGFAFDASGRIKLTEEGEKTSYVIIQPDLVCKKDRMERPDPIKKPRNPWRLVFPRPQWFNNSAV